MKTRLWTDEQLTTYVKDSTSFIEVLMKLKLGSNGGIYRWIKKHMQRLNLNTSHWIQSYSTINLKSKIPIKEILVYGKSFSSQHLKERLIKEKIFENKCFECDLTSWREKHISLHLDHINGDHNDNRLENLRLLCPNCHSQTPTYCERNIKNQKRCCDCSTHI